MIWKWFAAVPIVVASATVVYLLLRRVFMSRTAPIAMVRRALLSAGMSLCGTATMTVGMTLLLGFWWKGPPLMFALVFLVVYGSLGPLPPETPARRRR